jgi:hypothetical protein
VEEEKPPSEEEQLLAALRKKADAFANKDWETYWLKEGPALLTSGWLASHPNIPLAKVEEVCSLEFISSAIKSLSIESSSCEAVSGGEGGGVEGEEVYHTESIMAVSGGGRDEGVKIVAETRLDSEMEVSSAVHEGAALVPEPMASSKETASSDVIIDDKTVSEMSKDDSCTDRDEATLSSEAIVAMWNEHYNSYYWYTYEAYVLGHCQGEAQQLLDGGGGEGEGLQLLGGGEVKGEGEESQDSEAMEPQDTEVGVLHVLV